MMHLHSILLMMSTLACRKTQPIPETVIEPSMKTSHCAFDLEDCAHPGATKGEYEAAHSAFNDCLTGCVELNQTDKRSDEDILKECALLCDQSSYLESIIPVLNSYDIQILE